MKRNIIVALIVGVFLSVSCSLNVFAYTSGLPSYVNIDDIKNMYLIINYDSGDTAYKSIVYSDSPWYISSSGKFKSDGHVRARFWYNNVTNIPNNDYSTNSELTYGVDEGSYFYHETNQLSISKLINPSSKYEYVTDFDRLPSLSVYIGDDLMVKASSSQNNVNSIEGFTDIRVMWKNQPLVEKMFKLDIAYSSYWDNLTHTNTVVNIKTLKDEFAYNLGNPKLESEVMYYILYVYNSTGVFSDPLLGRYDKYYFKYTSLIKPTLNITGVVDGSMVYDRPNIIVSKQNSNKAYKIYINNHEIYNFTNIKNASYSIPQNYYDYGFNSVSVYDGVNLVKSVNFELKYNDTGGETGPWGWGNGEDGPPDDYQPAPIDDGKPDKPLPEDEYYKWIYYYLQLIVFYLELPFRLLLGLLKDVVKSIIDNINQLKTSYDSMFTASKLLFGFLPSPIVYLICLGMALSLALWFLGNIRRLK